MTEPEMVREIARRVRELRLAEGLRQETLANRSGVSLGTLKAFERTGRISLERLAALLVALHRGHELDSLAAPGPLRSLEEIENPPERRRGTR